MSQRSLTPLRMHRFAHSVWCRGVALVLLSVMLVAIVGVPMPMRVKRVGDEPYPCQDCRCGCSSAEFCWDRCCCHSDTEKLAWASEHNVIPPLFLVERVAKQDAEPGSSVAGTKSCCANHRVCCMSEPAASSVSCNQEAGDQEAGDQDVGDKAIGNAPFIMVVCLEDAAACHGLQLFWSLFSSTVIGTVRAPRVDSDPPLIAWLRIANVYVDSPVSSIDPPVPWASVSLKTLD